MPSAVIVDVLRTPVGRAHKGSLVSERPDDLAATVVAELMSRYPQVGPKDVDEVICGVSGGAGEQGQNLGRIVGQLAGLDEGTPGVSVNRFCASSVQALRMADQAIRAGDADVVMCVGVESVSRRGSTFAEGNRNPRLSDKSREDFISEMYLDMGETAERVADLHSVNRAEMDEFALLSHQRAVGAQRNGTFEREILPVRTADGRLVSQDDGPRPSTSIEALSQLPAAFRPDGRVTAGNSCPLNDGAAAALVMSEEAAQAYGLAPRARILGSTVTGIAPEIMGLGPIDATQRLLQRKRMSIGDIGAVELNEAFAAQVIPVCRVLAIDIETQLNIHGGAIAIGHPFGMTGMRLLSSLLNVLARRDQELGLITLCVGGGQGMAMLFERLS